MLDNTECSRKQSGLYHRQRSCVHTCTYNTRPREVIRQTIPVAGRARGPGSRHSGRGTLPPLDLGNRRTELSFTAKENELFVLYFKHSQDSISLDRTCTDTFCLLGASTISRSCRQADRLVCGREDESWHLLVSSTSMDTVFV